MCMKSLFKRIKILVMILFLMGTSLRLPLLANTHTDSVDLGYHWTGSDSHGRTYIGIFGRLYAGGELAYCIEPAILFVSGPKSTITLADYQGMDQSVKDKIELIDYYAKLMGADTNNHVYVTAQVMIWHVIEPSLVVNFQNGITDDDFNTIRAQINARIQNHLTKPSFDESSHQLKLNEPLVLTDNNQVISDFHLTLSHPEVAKLTQSGNTLTITPTAGGTTTITGHKVLDAYTGTSLVFYEEGSQNIASLKLNNQVMTSFNISVEATGNLQIAKVNKDNQPISQVSFNISTSPDMSNPITVITNDTGLADVSDLAPGSYYVKEVSVPEPYILSDEIKSVTIEIGQTTTVSFINEKAMGQIILTKTGPNQELIEGVEYQLFNANGDLVETLVTNSDGIIRSSILPLGNYELIETSIGAPYLLDSTPIPVVLSYKDQTVSLVINEVSQINDVAKGQIRIIKSDAQDSNNYLSNAVFEVIDKNQVVVDTLTTDEHGVALSKELDLGRYTLKEIQAPEGFVHNEEPIPIELVYKDQLTEIVMTEKEIINEPIKGKIQIVKVDASNEELPVQGAVFEILSLPNREFVETITSNNNGFAFSSDLRYGDYVIREIEAPQQFYLNKKEYPVSIREHEKVEILYVSNDLVEIKLGIQKIDHETNQPLSGAIFEIYDENNELVSFEYLNDNNQVVKQTQLITNNEGLAYTQGKLTYGTYTLVEKVAPTGYIRSEPQTFSITRDTETVDLEVIGRTTLKNISNQQTETHISKIDIYGNFVPGAVLTLYHQNQPIITFTSSNEPFVIKGLKVNETYTLVEEIAPEGYVVSAPVNITITETTQPQVLEMINERTPHLKTNAFFDNGLKESMPKENLKVVDLVEVTNLWVNKEYQMIGQLIDYQTHEVVSTSRLNFIAESEEMVVELKFELDTTDLLGKTLVVFEDLYRQDRHLATHHDLENKNQTVRIPNLSTSAASKDNQKEVLPLNDIVIVDKVKYTALNTSSEYELVGQLVLKENGKILSENTMTFTPQSSDGEVDLEFKFDASQYANKEVVVFESLYLNDVLIGQHKDLNDKHQTVKIVDPTLKTSASTNSRTKDNPTFVTIVDEVNYSNLIVGKEYQVKGILMDKETQLPLLIDDKEITSEISFVARSKSGTLLLEFSVNASKIKETSIVVFEQLYYQDQLISEHADIDDEDQTVHFYTIKIQKVDSKDSSIRLEGAQFELLTKDGIKADTNKTNQKGIVEFVVEKGEWIIKETEAPQGYLINPQEYPIVVDSSLDLEVQNKKIPTKLPTLGSKDSVLMTLSGSSLVGLGLYIFKRKKEVR